MHRVVVTGLGLLTPLGCSVDTSWRNVIQGKSGAAPITLFDPFDYGIKTPYACEIPRPHNAQGTSTGFCPDDWVEPREQRRLSDVIVYGLVVAGQALQDAHWHPQTEQEQTRTGVVFGSAMGATDETTRAAHCLHNQGARRISPFYVPTSLINLIAGNIAIRYALKGPNHSVVTACSSGAAAIANAVSMLRAGEADVIVAGGAESPINPLSMAGFNACRALSTGFADDPAAASRPFDIERDGFVMGEGAAAVVLETYEHAHARGAHIYAQVCSYGMSADAYHITAVEPTGNGLKRAINTALAQAGLSFDALDYINAHGTATEADKIELSVLDALLQEQANARKSALFVSSTKSSIGHLLGAAGAVEAIFSILAIRDQIAPPTLNLDTPLCTTPMNLCAKAAHPCSIRYALSNSMGFGGTNTVLVFGAIE